MTPQAIANPDIGMEFDPSMGLYLPEANPAPIGAVDAMDQPDPLAHTEHELAVMAKWEAEGQTPSSLEAEKIVSDEQAEALEQHFKLEAMDSGLMVPAEKEDASKDSAGFMSGIADSVSSFVKKHPKLSKATAALSIIGAVEAFSPDEAKASESGGGNNLVCGGVKSKKEALRLANGAPDDCGHTDIGKAWARLGITPEVIKTMHWGTVSSDDGLISQGRNHSPDPSKDKPVHLGPGDTIFERPLSVWGDTTYAALVGYTEDGQKVAILRGCGNGEGHHPPKPHKPHHPHKPPTGFVNVWKHALTATDELIVPTPSGIFQFDASCKVPGQKERVHNTFTYNPNGKDRPVRALTGCKVGSVAIVKELTPLGPDQWEMLSPVVQKQQVDPGKNLFTYKDRQVPHIGPPPPPPPPTRPNQPPTGEMVPPQHRYVNSNDKVCADQISDPDGDTVTASDFTFTGPMGEPEGQVTSGVFTLPGTNGETQCVMWTAPNSPMQITASADLSDGNNPPVKVLDNFPVIPDQF